MTAPKTVTRSDLALFLPNARLIRAFELLLANVNEVLPANIAALLTNVNYIGFNRTAGHSVGFGELAWNDVDDCLDIGMEYGVKLQTGLEYYARVENNTGVTIPNGTVVGFAGVGPGGSISVAPYLADGSQPSLYVLGVMTHDLPDTGTRGYCTAWGYVRDLDTSGFSVGDLLYPSPTVAGALTNVKPTAPQNVIPIAVTLVSHATQGAIFVRPTIEQHKHYGVFTKTTDQSPAVINTEYLLTFDNTEKAYGVEIDGTVTSRIVIAHESGYYKFDATLQFTSGSASAKTVWVWFKVNGATVPNTARLLTMDINGGYVPIALSEAFTLEANDYVEIAFAANDTAVTVDSVAATAFAPVAPAITLAVVQLQQ